jgi:ribosome modulation factor
MSEPLTRLDRLNAMRAGSHAGRTGQPVSMCPYGQASDRDRALAQAWVRAWTAEQGGPPPGIDYGDDTQQ